MFCEYCRGIGACPKCWGRSAIDRLVSERNALLKAARHLGACDLSSTSLEHRCPDCTVARVIMGDQT